MTSGFGHYSLTVSICFPWIIYSCYVVEVSAHTPDVPYGDHFHIMNRFCLTAIGPQKSRLRMSPGVVFEKSTIWKGKIEKGSHDALVEYGRELEQTLNRWLSGIPINNGKIEDRPKSSAGEQAGVTAEKQAQMNAMTRSRFENRPSNFDSQVPSSTLLDGRDSKALGYHEMAPKTTNLAEKNREEIIPESDGLYMAFYFQRST